MSFSASFFALAAIRPCDSPLTVAVPLADFLFLAFGNAPNTSFLPSSYLDESTHRVLVHPSFQTKANPRIFAIGDICSIEEPKLYANAKSHGGYVSQNIVSLIQGKAIGLKEYTPGAAMMVVSVGSKGGAGQLFGWVLGVSFPLSYQAAESSLTLL